jgi:hypothetical protein
MPRRFDHHLMNTNSVHLIIDPFAFSVQLSFYPEGRELIGDDSKGPTWRIRRGPIISEGDDLRWGSVLIALTEGTESTDRSSLLCCEIGGPSSSLCRNDHPPSMDGIFSQFGHDGSSF